MKQLSILAVISILLLLPVENSLARSGKDTPRKKREIEESSIKDTVVSTEDHILKGVIEPIDYHKISNIILDALSESPDHVSQIDTHTENKTTFREMKDRSIRLAIWMKKLGISPNDTIVQCSHNHLDTYIPLFATLFVDAIFSAWHPDNSLDRARLLMKQYTPKLIFTNEQTADVLLEAAKLENMDIKVIVFGNHSSIQSLTEIMNSQAEEEVSNFTIVNEKKSNDVSVILLSSGTTGIPKGIMQSSQSVYLLATEGQSIDSLEVVKVMWNSNLFWISGLQQILKSVLQKMTRIIGEFLDANQLFQTVEKYKVNVVTLPMHFINSIAKSNYTRNHNLESLKVIMVGGMKIHRNIFSGLRQKLPGVLILHGYGLTEAGLISLSSSKSEYLDSVGFVIPNRQVKIVDPTLGKALGPNEHGEIYVKSATMMIGYYKDPIKTQEVFDSDGWYHTGDLGYYHGNGEIFITDRISDIIKYKNHQISSGTIEFFLTSHPGVEEAAVVSIPDVRDGELPVFFITKVPESMVTKEEISGILSSLEDLKQLRARIYFLDKLPRNANGKIAKLELRQLAIDLSTRKGT